MEQLTQKECEILHALVLKEKMKREARLSKLQQEGRRYVPPKGKRNRDEFAVSGYQRLADKLSRISSQSS